MDHTNNERDQKLNIPRSQDNQSNELNQSNKRAQRTIARKKDEKQKEPNFLSLRDSTNIESN